jgi:ABC-type nitrate/sulfonate/bicarbonate transport system substrate-binding protein
MDAAEDSVLNFGMRLPDGGHQAPVLIATDRGFYADEGLQVRTVVTEDLGAGLVNGTLDLADMPSAEVLVDAVTKGSSLRLVCGWHGVRDYWIAVAAGIESPADLTGRTVILGAFADQPVRRHLLAEAGFDLAGIDLTVTNPPGGSDVWVDQLLSGQVDLAPVFQRHLGKVERAGARLVLDVSRQWPSNSVAATVSYLAQHPDTVTRFLRATLRAMRIWMDPANKEYVVDLWRRNGLAVNEAQIANYEFGFLRPFGRADLSLRAEEFDELAAGGGLLDAPAPFTSYADVRFLESAQRSLDTATE